MESIGTAPPVAHNRDQDRKLGDLFGRNSPHKGSHGRAVLRLDGFISADAAYTGGELVTHPLVFSGKSLQLNVDTSAGGIVKVEIQDPTGRPLPGFTEADAQEINGNSVRMSVKWHGSDDVGSLVGTPIRLRFIMCDSKLYSFQFLE